MPNKKINQLDSRVIAATDLMLVGDPSTGVSFKSLVSGLGAIYVPNSRTLTINGTTYDLSDNRTWNVGTVTSVNMSVPTGLTISGNPITGSGTLALALASGYTIPTQALLDGKVPYIGATGNVDLGEYELKAGQLTLDVSPTGTAVVGTTRWNNTIGSTETTLKGGTVVLKNGIDLVARVVNKVSPNATLTKAAYQAVRVTGAQGQRLAVAYAQANNDNNSADTIGLVCETIATNQEGFIITVGQLENINTTGSLQGETWNDGDVLYLSPTTPGAITNVKPAAPQHLVVIGYVEYAHANNGKIYVKVMNGWELGELHDVNTTGAVNGNVLKYNGSIWVPSSDIDTGITSINGLTALSQTFATGTTGTDFNIGSAGSTHTFNIPSASATNRGALTSADWTIFNGKENVLTFNSPLSRSTNTISIPVATSSVNGYLSSTDWSTFNAKQPAGNYITALTGEVTASGPGSAAATLLNSAVIGKVLTGLNLTGGGTISATDTILQAFGKTQNQISALVGGVMYEGVWNASTNTPAIVSGVGSKGDYYVVSVAGSINIDGISDWKIGDWIIFNGTNWDKVDNTDAVSSVNGFTGAVSLTTANISEVTNLYFTDARVMSAMLTGYTIGSNTAITFNDSVLTAFGKAQAQINTKQNIITLTTTGSSGSATFVSDTLNVPTYTLAGLGGQPQLNGTGFVKVTGTTISYDNSTYYLASNPNSFIALTALSAGTGISYNNTNGVITNTAPDQVVSLTAGNGISISGIYPSFTIASTITQYTDALARLAISESVTGLDYDNTTGVFSLTTGYVIPTTSSAANWDSAYNDKINSASVTGTTTKTLTLTQQDGGTITASWTDINTDAVNSVFGRTGAVVAVSGDYTTAQVTESGNLYYTDARARAAITLTTTGSSGSSTYSGGTLNIPTYTLSGLGGVPTTRTLTVNGTAYDLSADRTWNVGTVTSATATTGGQVAFFNGATVITSVSGLYFDGVDKLGIGTASPTYNLDVTGTARMTGNLTAASLIKSGGTSSQYLMADGSVSTLTNPVTGTGTTNYLPKWTSGSALGNSLVYDDGTNVGIGTASPVSIGTGYTALTLLGSNGGGVAFGTSANKGYIYTDARLNIQSGNFPIAFLPNGVEKMRLTDTGNLLLNSTTDNGNRLQVSGNGYFSGNVGVGTSSPNISGYEKTITLVSSNNAAFEVSANNVRATYVVSGGSVSIIGTETNHPLLFQTNATEKMRLTSSGNLGLGVTPSSWSAGKAIQVDSVAVSLWGVGNQTALMNNAYYNSGDKYAVNGEASYYLQASGSHKWFNAPSGTAGNAISFTQAMTLTSGGNLLVGTSVDSGYRLDVGGTGYFTGTLYAMSTSTAIYVNGGYIYTVGRYANSNSGNILSNNGSGTNLLIGETATNFYGIGGGTLGGVPTNGITLNTSTGDATFSSSVTAAAFIPSYNTLYYTTDGRISNYSASNYLYVNGNAGGGLFLKGEGDGINNIRIESSTLNLISFQTNSSERARITSGGNLLVGTSTDSGYKLDVNGTGRFTGQVNINNSSALRLTRFSTESTYYGDVAYTSAGLILTSIEGYIKIGKGSGSSPTTYLSIIDGGAATFSSSVTATSTLSARTGFTSAGTAGTPYFDEAIIIGQSANQCKIQYGNSFSSNNGTWLKFVVNSNVAANTPVDALTLRYDGAATFSSSVTAGTPYVSFDSFNARGKIFLDDSTRRYVTLGMDSNVATINCDWYSGAGGASPDFAIKTNATERIRITSGGNLLVGTSVDSGERLQVSGSSKFNGNTTIGSATSADVFSRGYSGRILGISASGQSAIELNSSTGNGAYFDMGVNGTRTFGIYSDTINSEISTTGSYPLLFSTNAIIRLTIKSNGSINYQPMATPSSPSAGDVYYDSTSNKLRCYNGTSWNDLF